MSGVRLIAQIGAVGMQRVPGHRAASAPSDCKPATLIYARACASDPKESRSFRPRAFQRRAADRRFWVQKPHGTTWPRAKNLAESSVPRFDSPSKGYNAIIIRL